MEMTEAAARELALSHRPILYRDAADPFPARYLGYTVFTERRRSESFPKWAPDPAALGLAAVVEYAVYYDYDIQHMYDLEHVWAGVDGEGRLRECWSSFHGMRLHASGVSSFRAEGGRPVLYAQPGKHALLPDPELFGLVPDLRDACRETAGGGLLIPGFLSDRLATDETQNARIRQYIRDHYSFTPAMEFIREDIPENQYIPWPELLSLIPELVEEEIRKIGG